MPEKLDDFQNMKYNESEKWGEAKEAYRDVNWQKEALEKHSSGEMHTSPFQGKPNSVFDNFRNGELVQRRFYGKTGNRDLISI